MTKPLRTIVVTTPMGTYTIEDTIECPSASLALNALEHGENATVIVDGTPQVIFANSVESISVTETESDEYTRPDPVCPEII